MNSQLQADWTAAHSSGCRLMFADDQPQFSVLKKIIQIKLYEAKDGSADCTAACEHVHTAHCS